MSKCRLTFAAGCRQYTMWAPPVQDTKAVDALPLARQI
jgi:hypothetical protein